MTPRQSPFKTEAERNKIINRIRKILAIANGTNFEGEANTAMKTALEYMAKYNLSMSEVELKESLDQPIVHETLDRDVGNQEKWEQHMCCAIAEVFDCRPIKVPSRKGGWRMSFIGYKDDVELCKMLFNVLLVSAKAAAN